MIFGQPDYGKGSHPTPGYGRVHFHPPSKLRGIQRRFL